MSVSQFTSALLSGPILGKKAMSDEYCSLSGHERLEDHRRYGSFYMRSRNAWTDDFKDENLPDGPSLPGGLECSGAQHHPTTQKEMS